MSFSTFSFNFLPFDILWKIVQYLSFDEAVGLRSVNRHFLEISRSLQYRKLLINGYGKRTKLLLKGINSSSLGNYVHSLHIEPWAISNMVSIHPHRRRKRDRVFYLVDNLHSFFDSEYPTRKAQALFAKRLRKQIDLVSETTRKLPFVTEYSVGWDQDRSYHAELFTAFLSLADVSVSLFGKNLTKLSLKVPTDRLVCLASVKLPSLEELNLHLATESLSERYINECLDCFVVFVNNLYLTLRSLSVTTSYTSHNLNLSYFFHLLGDFAKLHTLAITIPYDGAHFSSLDSLGCFIQKHSRNLQELKLLCTRSGPRAPTRPNDPRAKYWIQRIVAEMLCAPRSPRLRDLHKLELAIRPLRSQLEPFLDFLATVADQLDSLVLTDDALTPMEVGEVLDALVSRDKFGGNMLSHLSLKLQYLCPYTIDLLASKLPGLKSLKLTFSDVRCEHSTLSTSLPATEELMFFLMQLHTRRYTGWNLTSLAISECPYHLKWGTQMEQVFLKCIPALRSASGSFEVFNPASL